MTTLIIKGDPHDRDRSQALPKMAAAANAKYEQLQLLAEDAGVLPCYRREYLI